MRTDAVAGWRSALVTLTRLVEARVGRGTGMRAGMQSPKSLPVLERTHCAMNGRILFDLGSGSVVGD